MKKLLNVLALVTITSSSVTTVSAFSPLLKTNKGNLQGPAQNLLDKIQVTDVTVQDGVNPDVTNASTAQAIRDSLVAVNTLLTADEAKDITFEGGTLELNEQIPIIASASVGSDTAFIAISVKMVENVSPQDIVKKIKNKNIDVPAGTDPDVTNTTTVEAIRSALIKANPDLTSNEASYITFQGGPLVVEKGVAILVQVKVQDKVARTAIIVTLQKSIKPSPDIPDLSNYDMSQVRPVAAPAGIDYNKSSYTPWFDDGFNWYQFFEGGTGLAGFNSIADTITNKILDSQNQVINLGFLTAVDPKAFASSSSRVVSAFKTWVNESSHEGETIPSIGGIIPLWMINWTDAWGASTPASHEAGSTVFKFLDAIRKAGKDYRLSFGGWNHDSIAMDAYLKGYSAEKLAAYYEKIVEALDLHSVDFDVEGTETGSTDDWGNTHTVEEGSKARTLRLNAVKILKEKNPELHIQFTYPALVNGIEDKGMHYDTITSYLKDGIIDKLAVMPFDAYSWKTGKRITLPGESAIYTMSSINAVAAKLKASGVQNPYSKIEAIQMIGNHDQQYEIWTLTDQALFVNYAISKKLGGYGLWSTIRDMEQQINSDPNLPSGHNLGKLWTYEDMLNNSGKKDAYSSGLWVKNLAYSDLAKDFTTHKLYDFNGKINIDSQLWAKIKELKIATVGDVSNITQADIESLYNTNYFFSDNAGFGSSAFTGDKAALQAELNWSDWADLYLDHNLQ